MQVHEYSGQTGKIVFREYGSGKTIVLLHGFGESGAVWEDTVKAFDHQYRFLVPDIPGSGLSPALAEKTAAMEVYANLIQEMITSHTNEKIVLLGHSMGGYVTLTLAEKSPEYLKGWGLIHSTAFADSAEKIAIRKKAITFMLENGSKAFLQTSIPGLFHNKETHKKEIQNLIDQADNFDPHVLAGYYEAMIARPDHRKALSCSNVPVFMIAGKYDQAVPLFQSLEQCHLAPNCQFSILRNSAHMGMLEETEPFRQHFGSFLASIFI
jgi:pimeloyl-ACP methyl ester carboxylesterase